METLPGPRPKSSFATLLVLAALAAVLASLISVVGVRIERVTHLKREDALATEVASASSLAGLPVVPQSARAEVVAPAPSAPAHQETARDFLAGYYGARWKEVETKIAAAGQDLDIPYFFTPWEDVANEFESRIGMSAEGKASLVKSELHWPEVLTPAFVNQSFPLSESQAIDESDVPPIETLVADVNGRITELAQYFADLIDTLVHEKWRTGDYLRAPYTTAGLSDVRGFHSQSHGGRGWAVTITLTREEYPQVPQIEERISDLIQERDELVAGYLHKRFTR